MHYSHTLKTRKKTKTLKLISHGKITSVLDIKDRKSIILLFSFKKCLLQKTFFGRPPLFNIFEYLVVAYLFVFLIRSIWRILLKNIFHFIYYT